MQNWSFTNRLENCDTMIYRGLEGGVALAGELETDNLMLHMGQVHPPIILSSMVA